MLCRLPYISEKYKMAPLVKLEEEMIDLQAITEDDGRTQLVKFLLKTLTDETDESKKVNVNFQDILSLDTALHLACRMRVASRSCQGEGNLTSGPWNLERITSGLRTARPENYSLSFGGCRVSSIDRIV